MTFYVATSILDTPHVRHFLFIYLDVKGLDR